MSLAKHLPEPEMEWYITPTSPCIRKTTRRTKSQSANSAVVLSPVQTKEGSGQDSNLITLLGKVNDLEKNMHKLIERMERLETAVVRLQVANRELPPPLPPRNKTIPPTITQEVSLQISPGFLVPAKLTDL